jgi:hypothetical protein
VKVISDDCQSTCHGGLAQLNVSQTFLFSFRWGKDEAGESMAVDDCGCGEEEDQHRWKRSDTRAVLKGAAKLTHSDEILHAM